MTKALQIPIKNKSITIDFLRKLINFEDRITNIQKISDAYSFEDIKVNVKKGALKLTAEKTLLEQHNAMLGIERKNPNITPDNTRLQELSRKQLDSMIDEMESKEPIDAECEEVK